MAALILRRSVATAGLAVLATLASPLVGMAMADPAPALTAGTFSPADGDTVAANRPPISATYNTELNKAKSTIAVTDVTNASTAEAVPCTPAFTSDSKTIGCTLGSDLKDGHDYKVAVHAENADSSSKLDESATWTVDIPSVVVTTPANNATVAVAQVLSATYDEEISSKSTVSVVNGFGSRIPGVVSIAKSSAQGACPSAPCILNFTASQTLPQGTYAATFHADGVTAGLPSSSDNPNAFDTTVVHFTVNKVKPSIAPQNVVAPANITQANVAAVPFSGYAQPGFKVNVAIYNETCDADLVCGDTEGKGPEDGLGSTTVDNCEDSAAHTVNGIRLCPFSLTVDDSNGCDTGAPEMSCGGGDTFPGDTADNQWYAFSSSPAGQVPSGASPGSNPHINRDTTGPNAPDSPNATGYVTNNSPSAGQATVTVSATDSAEFPTGPDAYIARVSDQFGDSKDVTLAPSAGNLNATFAMPSGIYDGALTIEIAAADEFGNASDFVTANTPNGKSQTKEIVALAPANPSTHVDSMQSSNGSTYDFASLPSTGTPVKVGLPSAITVHFNEPIQLQPTDNSGSGTPRARLCILAPGGICENTIGVGTLANPDADRTTLTWTAPEGFGADLPSGDYTIAAFAPAASCGPRQPLLSYSCETSGGVENDPTSWTTLATFTVDKVAPTIQTFTVTPTTITPSSVKSVTLAGTSDADTRDIQVSIKSSAGGTTLLRDIPVAAPSDPSATSVSWTLFPLDLSTVRDGTLTISAIAIDDAGNKTPAPGSQTTATLRAHVSTLTESVTTPRITYGQITQVRGRLVDQNGNGISKATVLVRPRFFASGAYGATIKAVTDSTGHWGVIAAPAHNVAWYASYAGSTASPLHDAASVHSAKTLVRVAIHFTSPRNHATVGSPVVLKGKVAPNKHGATVKIYRHTSSGNKLVAKFRLGKYSRWAYKLRLPHGTFRFFAVIGNTRGNLGNRTGYLTLKH